MSLFHIIFVLMIFIINKEILHLILVHPKFGFGMMNAEGMVSMAKIWKPIEAQQIYSTPLNTQVV